MIGSRECFLGGTISCGLKLLHHVLLEVKDHAQLVSVMRDNIKFAPRSFLDDGLDEATQHVRNQQLRDLGENGVAHHLSRVTVKIIHHWPGI